MRVRVLRALCQKGKRIEPGAVLDLPDHEAREDLHRGVVERVTPAPTSPSGPLTTESAADLVEGSAVRTTTPSVVAGKKRKDAQEK